ncbi:DsbA family protein [Microvirga sp. M2]|uniref:DsbA family protein n=1 Tax=Microvirga sp. M2 TaxID=3073270 RepID=UPI0039C1592F
MAHLTPPVGPQDKTQGPETAPVTLVEYGDYECPACGMAYGILKRVQNEMGDDLRFVFRNFPLTEVHPHAEHAAAIAEEAAVAGRFWPMHDLLFENQGALDDPSLVAYGEQLGLGERDLLAALGGSHAQRIREDFLSGVRSGVNGTPTLFVNGQRYDGPVDPESLLVVLRQQALSNDR